MDDNNRRIVFDCVRAEAARQALACAALALAQR
jgi:hypothetical protein